jgi:xanthine dehydrogenase accessory factor
LKDAAEEVSVHHQLHDKIAARNQSGMICSGEQTLFLYTVQLKDLAPINAMIRSLEEYQQGSLQLSPAGVGFSNDVPKENFLLEIRPNDNFLYIEKTGFKNNLYIIGAGHCALSLSKLMSSMDYCIHVFDDRQDLNTLMLNGYAHKKILVNDYKELDALIPSSNNCFAVIMTVGYRTDEVALKALLDKDLAYLGMLGSKSKVDKLFKSLLEEGISSALLGKVHAPIGIQIKSQTPEEIAVSIAAEIIREKNRDL